MGNLINASSFLTSGTVSVEGTGHLGCAGLYNAPYTSIPGKIQHTWYPLE